jgi:hypothetical protein
VTTTSSHPTDAEAPSTAVQPRGNEPGPQIVMAPEQQRKLWGTCAALARADWLPDGVRGRAGNIFAVALLGEQFKLDPMPAVLNIHIIESTNQRGEVRKSVVLSAQLWIKLARDAGHRVRAKTGHPTEEECVVYLWRGDEPDLEPHEAKYTLTQAKRAGLVRSGSNYEKNPEDMLFARAAVRVIRRAAGEVALANAVDEYEAEAMQYEESAPAAPAAANLAEAAATREPKATPEKPIEDAEIVPDGPTPAQVADLERQHAPGPDLDDRIWPPIEATVPEGKAERRAGGIPDAATHSFGAEPTRDPDGGDGVGEGDDPADDPDTARPPRAEDWAEPTEEPAETWAPTEPDPWGITEPAPTEKPKRGKGRKA